jgi:hypothetical protein
MENRRYGTHRNTIFIFAQNEIVRYEETGKTIVADFDSFPSDKIFTLAGLDLPAGTQFTVDSDKGARIKYWNGKELSDYPGLSVLDREPSKNRWAVLFTINAIVMGILAYLFWKRRTDKLC